MRIKQSERRRRHKEKLQAQRAKDHPENHGRPVVTTPGGDAEPLVSVTVSCQHEPQVAPTIQDARPCGEKRVWPEDSVKKPGKGARKKMRKRANKRARRETAAAVAIETSGVTETEVCHNIEGSQRKESTTSAEVQSPAVVFSQELPPQTVDEPTTISIPVPIRGKQTAVPARLRHSAPRPLSPWLGPTKKQNRSRFAATASAITSQRSFFRHTKPCSAWNARRQRISAWPRRLSTRGEPIAHSMQEHGGDPKKAFWMRKPVNEVVSSTLCGEVSADMAVRSVTVHLTPGVEGT